MSDPLAHKQCELVGGGYAFLLQLFLGFAALSSLVVKRMKEVPKRPLQVWLFDTGKQAIGALFIHLWNVLLSIIIVDSKRSRGAENVDECALYFVQFVLDVFVGTIIIWALIRTQEVVAVKRGIRALQVSGDYGKPPSFYFFWLQLLAYLFNLAMVKTIITVVTVAMDVELTEISDALFRPVEKYPDLELTIVMVFCPWILNALQFWIIDNVIKKDAPTGERYANLQEEGGEGGDDASSDVIELGDDEDEEVDLHSVNGLKEPAWMAPGRGRKGGGGGGGGGGVHLNGNSSNSSGASINGLKGAVGGVGKALRKGRHTVSMSDGSGSEAHEVEDDGSSYMEHYVANSGAVV